MAEDNALRLISKIIYDRDITTVLERGVTADWFPVLDHRQLFEFITAHYRRYGQVPSPTTVKSNFPRARILRVEDPLDYMLDELISWRRQQGVIGIIRRATDDIEDGHHEAAILTISQGLLKLESQTPVGSSDIDLTVDPQSRWQEYQDRKDRGSTLLGLPTGFPTIDNATSGIQAGQLITVVATPKAGKSTLAMRIALNVHKAGYVPLFQSFEMSNREQKDRHDAMRAGISHTRLIRSLLSTAEERAYQRILEMMEDGEPSFILSDAAEGLTLSAVQAKIGKYRPELLIVDGVYLMYDEITGERNTPQALTNITRGFKAFAQRNKIPVIITTQALTWKMRGSKLSADAIGYSSSFFQDSDVILGLELINEDEETSRSLRVVASRNCGPADVELHWDWEKSDFRELGDAA